MNCTKCDRVNPDDATFCGGCGTLFVELPDGAAMRATIQQFGDHIRGFVNGVAAKRAMTADDFDGLIDAHSRFTAGMERFLVQTENGARHTTQLINTMQKTIDAQDLLLQQYGED